jgi:hypothetical protein
MAIMHAHDGYSATNNRWHDAQGEGGFANVRVRHHLVERIDLFSEIAEVMQRRR